MCNTYVSEKYYVVIKKKGKGLYMIRVKFGHDDWTFLKVFQVYQECEESMVWNIYFVKLAHFISLAGRVDILLRTL